MPLWSRGIQSPPVDLSTPRDTPMHNPSRRIFLAQGATLVAASALPARSANETINVACLGAGGRCRHLMGALAKVKNVRIVAVCDVWDQHLADSLKLADPKAITSRDYKALLARKATLSDEAAVRKTPG